MRCRTEFTTFNRKHHCRKCGLTFCNDCCNKRIPLPSLGITDAVRVCESCYYKVTNPTYNTPPNQSSQNIDFNDNEFYGDEQPENSDEEEEQLRQAIEASLNDIKISETTSPVSNEPRIASDNPDELLTTEIENIKLFSQLMEKISAEAPVKGAQAINDTQIQALHVQISSLHPKVIKNKNFYEEKYKKFNDIHEKLIVAKRLYDQILSQRIDAARPGNLYSSALYQPSSSTQQPYTYNPYGVPPTNVSQPPVVSREGSVDTKTQPAYLNQYPAYPPASQPLNYAQLPLPPLPPSQPPPTVPVQSQPSVPGQDLSLQQPQTIPPQQVPLQQVPQQVQAPLGQIPPTQAPLGQAPLTQAPLGQAPPAQVPLGQAPPAQAPLGQVPQPIANPQDMKTMPYGTEYAQPSVAPYVQQPYMTMQQPNAVPEAQQAPYTMAPAPVVQQAPPPEPVEEKPLIEL
ncbi:hypothetical protein PIROE2DRAFT_57647 [Piromyces sp. E2]|nr:hypothetical protein PIROE2DRAFT_57647 [Piromyces sp. E2]|eukprot:OUM69153.1 hypothetical protein PIROE2DRAFT_57647 [Piromyces sp. E2]